MKNKIKALKVLMDRLSLNNPREYTQYFCGLWM